MSEKPWCHKCGVRHDDPRMEIDGPLWSGRGCKSSNLTIAEMIVLVYVILMIIGLATFALLYVLPFVPTENH